MQRTILSLIVAAVLVPFVGAQAAGKGKADPAKAAPVSKTFKVGADCKIMSADKAITLADLKVGDKVALRYKDDSGTLNASHIRVLVEPKEGEAPPAKGEHRGGGKGGKRGAPADTDLHAHGAITAVDANAGTITVDVVAPRGERHAK